MKAERFQAILRPFIKTGEFEPKISIFQKKVTAVIEFMRVPGICNDLNPKV
jgi:hypothetical protein